MEPKKKPRIGLRIALSVGIIITVLALMALSPIGDPPKLLDRTEVNMREIAYLTDLDMHVLPAEGRILIVGSVKNLTSEPLKFIKVTSTAQDKNGHEIGSGWGMIYVLKPGQVLPLSYYIECDLSELTGVKTVVKSVWQ